MFLVSRLSYNQFIFPKVTRIFSVKYIFEHIGGFIKPLWPQCCQDKVHFLSVAYKDLFIPTSVYTASFISSYSPYILIFSTSIKRCSLSVKHNKHFYTSVLCTCQSLYLRLPAFSQNLHISLKSLLQLCYHCNVCKSLLQHSL